MYHILIFAVVSSQGQKCSEKYYGHEVIMKLCTGYAVLCQIIYVSTQFTTWESYARNLRNN